jgi:HAD superfamily phosphoserine phosphatase-like hydrolase
MQKTYALFDFDGTLIRGDSILLLCLYARRKGLVSWCGMLGNLRTAFLYGLRLCPAVRAKERALSFLWGKTAAEVDAIAEDFCQAVLVPRLRPQGLSAIQSHRTAGHEVLLVSASSTFYLKHLQKRLNVNDVIATRLDGTRTAFLPGGCAATTAAAGKSRFGWRSIWRPRAIGSITTHPSPTGIPPATCPCSGCAHTRWR